MQISSQIVTTNKEYLYIYLTNTRLFTGRMPFLSPNHVRALKEKSIAYHGFAHPKFTWDLPSLSLTTKGCWLPWGRGAKHLISPLMPVSHNTERLRMIYHRHVCNSCQLMQNLV